MRLLWCCILSMVVMATGFPKGTLDNYQDPQNLDTPDDQDDRQDANANPQGNPGSSYFVPTAGGSSSSSSSEEEGSDTDTGSVPIGSIPSGTVGPGGSPVVGGGATGGNAAGVGAQGGGGVRGGAQGGGRAGSTDQDSGEQSPGGGMLQKDPSFLSKIQAQPKGNTQHSGSAGKSVGITIGVLGLVSVATVGIIFAIRKKRDGFMRFYSQASNEL